MPVDGQRERRGGMTEDRLHRLGGRSPLEGSTSGSRKHSRQRSSSVSGGRLELQGVDTRSITARCRGDSGELYKLGYYEEGGGIARAWRVAVLASDGAHAVRAKTRNEGIADCAYAGSTHPIV